MDVSKKLSDLFGSQQILLAALRDQNIELWTLLALAMSELQQHEFRQQVIQVSDEFISSNQL